MSLITILILLGLVGFITGERETIRHFQINENWQRKPLLYRLRKKFPELWSWYVGNKWKYKNRIVQFLMRYPLAMFKDGWHSLKSTEILIVCFIIADLTPYVFNLWIIPPVITEGLLYYIVIGITFNISYHT